MQLSFIRNTLSLLSLLWLVAPLHAQVFSVAADPSTLGPIPDGGDNGPGDYGVTRVIGFEVSGTEGFVGSIAVEFSANHPFVGDLRMRLVAPNGFTHQLFEQSGVTVNSAEGFATNLVSSEVYIFSDQTADHWWTRAGIEENGVPVDVDIPGGAARTVQSGGQSEPDALPPVTSMDEVFLGQPVDGTWRLFVDDGFSTFEGEVTAASLFFEFDTPDQLVTNTNDSGPGSLRQAMLDAQSGQTIAFDPNVFNTPLEIELSSALPVITQPLFIQGPGADRLTISRDASLPDFSLLETSNFDGTFAVSGLRLFGGNFAWGGGMHHFGTQYVRASGMDIDSNFAGTGGGVYIENADAALLLDSTVRSNGGEDSTFGSGVFLNCYTGGECAFALVNSTVSGNASGGFSGPAAIEVESDADSRQVVQLFNSTIVSDGVGVRLSARNNGGSTDSSIDAFYVSTLFDNTNASIAQGGTSTGPVDTNSFGGNLSNLDEPGLFDEPDDQVNVDPQLQALADNGGPTPTHALPAGSPAIDVGLNPASLIFDQRGPGFTREFGGQADAGAFEFVPEDRIFGSRFEFVADIVAFDNVDFVPNEDFTGGSIRWLDGATCDCDDDTFDFNIYGDAPVLAFFWPRIGGAGAGVTLDGSTYAVLSSGDTVGPQSDFIATANQSDTVAWSTPGNVTGYLGFRFEDEGQTKYGYALISTGTNGRPFTLLSYAFDNNGGPIVIP